MKKLLQISLKALTLGGGWFPLLVFSTHVFADRVLHLYDLWPHIDIPMHFSGGLAIAFFVSRCFQLLPRESFIRSRIVLLELVLILSITVSATALWEFAEFSIDQLLGTNIQVSLANTIQDMVMGTLGALVLVLIRARKLRISTNELYEFAIDWIQGETV